MSNILVDLIKDATGTTGPTLKRLYGYRSVVNYQTLTTNVVNRSQNLSSVTDSAVGFDLMNFTNNYIDIYYTAAATAAKDNTTDDGDVWIQLGGNTTNVRTTSNDRSVTRRVALIYSDVELSQYTSEGDLA